MIGLISGTPTADGSFGVNLTVTDGAAVATGTLQLTFVSDPAIPVIVSPGSATLSTSRPFNYTIVAPSTAGPNDPTVFTLLGAENLPAGLTFDPATGTISGNFIETSNFSTDAVDPHVSGGVITNVVATVASNSVGTAISQLQFFREQVGLVNISTRLSLGQDPKVLIGGFIIVGNSPKKLIARAIASSLPVPGALQDPVLELAGDGIAATNDDWRSTQEQEIIATTVPPTDNRESAVVAVLRPFDPAIPGSGQYTAIVRGKNGASGIGLVEVFDLATATSLERTATARLANISTRGFVQTGDDVMIGGFIIKEIATRVIVRAIGPDLGNRGVPGALPDTTLELRDGIGNLIASNDDWESHQRQQIIDTTVPPNDPRESAIVANLPPGNYTAIVRGKNGGTGVGLVEVFALQ